MRFVEQNNKNILHIEAFCPFASCRASLRDALAFVEITATAAGKVKVLSE